MVTAKVELHNEHKESLLVNEKVCTGVLFTSKTVGTQISLLISECLEIP